MITSLSLSSKIFCVKFSYKFYLLAYYKTTNHRQANDPPANNYRLTERSSTDSPIADRRLFHSFSILRLTDHQVINSLTLLQFTTNPFIQRTYFSRVTIGPIFLLTNYKWSFALGTFYYWIRRIIRRINADKLQILLIIPFGNWYLEIGIWNKNIGRAHRFSKCLLSTYFFLFLWRLCCKTFFISLFQKKRTLSWNRVLSNSCCTGLQLSESFYKTKLGGSKGLFRTHLNIWTATFYENR